ncbi:MAG: inorganic diphosphatase [Patescibacteria group bacterium]
MSYTAIIEIPKGSDRRIHKKMGTDKLGEFIDLGPTKEILPINGGIMPVCYGYLENIFNKEEGDEVDVLIFSNKEHKTGDIVQVEVFGIFVREDKDHKILARDESVAIDIVADIEPELLKLTREFFGHKHKIILVDDKDAALEYLKECQEK